MRWKYDGCGEPVAVLGADPIMTLTVIVYIDRWRAPQMILCSDFRVPLLTRITHYYKHHFTYMFPLSLFLSLSRTVETYFNIGDWRRAGG